MSQKVHREGPYSPIPFCFFSNLNLKLLHRTVSFIHSFIMICLEFSLFSFYPHICVLLFCWVFFFLLEGVVMCCDVCS